MPSFFHINKLTSSHGAMYKAAAVLAAVLMSVPAVSGCGASAGAPSEEAVSAPVAKSEVISEAGSVAAADAVSADEAVPVDEDTAPESEPEAEVDDSEFPALYNNETCLDIITACDMYTFCDVDCDGTPELIVCTENESGESVQSVYQYDSESDTLNCEVSIPYSLLFYTNGNIRALWPLNKGLNPDIMPYNMYLYDAGSDKYIYGGYVDSWNVEYNATDYEGNDFPADLDEDGDGILYSIYYNDDYGYGYIHDGDSLSRLQKELYDADIIEPLWNRPSAVTASY